MTFDDAMMLLVFLGMGAWIWLICYLTFQPLDKPLFWEKRNDDNHAGAGGPDA